MSWIKFWCRKIESLLGDSKFSVANQYRGNVLKMSRHLRCSIVDQL